MSVSTETTRPSVPGLPPWRRALVVVAHPDDESFGLGAVIDRLVSAGTVVEVLCLTHGEASTLQGVEGDLAVVRAAELDRAAEALGISRTVLRTYPDGGLAGVGTDLLAEEVVAALGDGDLPDALVAFDPSGITGHSDHRAATDAALAAAARLDLPVLGWTLPADVARDLAEEFGAPFTGHGPDDVDLVLPVTRRRQRVAAAAHASQALPESVLWRRLELLGDVEHLRWLRPPVTSRA